MTVLNKVSNQECHDFIDVLAEQKMTGELTLYFQNGDIESCRTSKRYTKKELQTKASSKNAALPKK